MANITYEIVQDPAVGELEGLIAPPENTHLYGIIDGASVPDFLPLAKDSVGQYECLFAGELSPEVERAAPYLVELLPRTKLLHKWWSVGWGKHWGIMAHVPDKWSFEDVRKWFRTFLRVQLPDGRYALFRYYDPRIMREYLPTCTAKEITEVFGPVTAYFIEDKDEFGILRFAAPEDENGNRDKVEVQRAVLARGQGNS